MSGLDAFARALVPDLPDDIIEQLDRELCTLPTEPDEVAELVRWLRRAIEITLKVYDHRDSGTLNAWYCYPGYGRKNVEWLLTRSWCHRDAERDPVWGRRSVA